MAVICHAQQTHSAILAADPGNACDIVGLVDMATGIAVYPNPTDGILTVACPQHGVTLRLFDMKGRQLLTQGNAVGRQRLDLGHLSEGVYILAAESAQGRSHQRIVISR
jgi:hypothetical protein